MPRMAGRGIGIGRKTPKAVRVAARRLQANRRETERVERLERRRQGDRDQHARQRAEETDEATAACLDAQRVRDRQRRRVPRSQFDARRASEVLKGDQIVKESDVGVLLTAEEEVGAKSKQCQHCHAVSWKKERPGFCCSAGKVSLPPLFDTTKPRMDVFQRLWMDGDERSRLFRKHDRALNNALTLASLKVAYVAPPGRGWVPSVVIQGKVAINMGPLQVTDQRPPIFSQLYVLDPDLADRELELRTGILFLSSSITEAEKPLLRDLVEGLQQMMREMNPYVKDFQHACEIVQEDDPRPVQLMIDANKRPAGEHARRFNPGFAEISVVMDDQKPRKQDLVVKMRAPGNHVQEVPDNNRACDSLRFILFFPDGVDGWHTQLEKKQEEVLPQEDVPDDEGEVEEAEIRRDRGWRCTAKMFYCFHLQIRHPQNQHFNQILRGGRLMQESVCLAQHKIENQRLTWLKENQASIRAEKYQKLYEDVHAHDAANPDGAAIRAGKLTILPPSFPGSPRSKHLHHQDAMAIVRVKGKPQFFLTFTCNPQWPEITAQLFPGQQSHDRPDLVARVFHQKYKQYLDLIMKGEVLGKVAGHVNVIEFQKRGLPHNHMLIILDNETRVTTADEVDEIICAEFPPDPMEFPEGPRRERAQKLQDLVLKNMVHTCGTICLDENRKCRKGFPKQFSKETHWDDNAYYPLYRRRMDGRQYPVGRNEVMKDNRWIVPYNPFLLLTFGAHINVECCISIASIKYLYKYVYKGPDRVMLGTDVDEISEYQNLRSIGAAEACWDIFEFDMHGRTPAVMALRIHLENEQRVYFDEQNVRQAVAAGPQDTELTAFFAFNEANAHSNNPMPEDTYVNFPLDHTWNKTVKQWQKRKTKRGQTVGRVHTVHPTSGEVFYLRILLHKDHSKGKISFRHLLTYEGVQYASYKEVCQAMGLLDDDGEWEDALTEAALTASSRQIRQMFIVMLTFCYPANPRALYTDHQHEWADDFSRRYPDATPQHLEIMVLLDLERRLQEKGRELADPDINLIVPTQAERQEIARLRNEAVSTRDTVIMQEEQDFDVAEVAETNEQRVATLNEGQRAFYQEMVDLLETESGGAFFLDARGGTGKTYLLNAIAARARTMGGEKGIALAVASSGIAATLLELGRTFHSRFRVPVKNVDDEDMTFNINPNDSVAKVICMTRVIIWDEAPMMNRTKLEGLDRTLQDVTGLKQLFGGKLFILAGDFRQVLPVIKHGSRAQIAAASLTQSPLWQRFNIRRLEENMRIGADADLQHFDEHLKLLGDGELPIQQEPDWIELPPNSVTTIDNSSAEGVEEARATFINIIFPGLQAKATAWTEDPDSWTTWLAERAILAPKNSEVDKINRMVVENFPGEETLAASADSTANPEEGMQFPVEFLNLQTPSGLPPHELVLKEGIILILLRNLNPRSGLCNGTRLILKKASRRLLHCQIASGEKAGDDVLIPRIELTTDEGDFPLKWKRRQFPVRPAFSMTVNKAQGQTLRRVGVWLHEPCFSHGQLYVASSRVGNPAHLFYAVNESDAELTRNVVFAESLL